MTSVAAILCSPPRNERKDVVGGHDMPETSIEMEARHVVEGAARVARQEVIVARMDRIGSEPSIANSHELLRLFRETLRLSRERLASLQAK